MANPWYTRALSFPLGQTARGDNVQSELDAVQTAFDRLKAQFTHRFTNADYTGLVEFTENAAARANRIPMFNASGVPVLKLPADVDLAVVTSFIETLLDDVDAATARATLGVSGVEVLDQAFEDIASATTTDIGAATSRNVRITGTTPITGFGTAPAGTTRRIRFAAVLDLTHNGTSLILPGSANITTTANATATAVSLGSGNWIVTQYQRVDLAPTRQVFLSGSGTYTTPAGVRAIMVRMIGAGGGGGGNGTSGQTAGGSGGDTTFSTYTAGGGGGGPAATAGALSSGAAGGTTSGSPDIGIEGGGGGAGSYTGTTPAAGPGGVGGSGAFGGGARSTTSGNGQNGRTNSGGGGAGAAGNATVFAAAGGGSGAYVEHRIAAPDASYSYAVGAAGSAGSAGTSGSAGGVGGSGIIIVEEYY